MRPAAPPINLLHEERKSFIDQFVSWALTIGRLLLIVTETLALAVFVYRFTLDRQLVDLHDEIKRQQVFVRVQQDQEKLYRSIQQRLATADKLTVDIPKKTALLQDVLKEANTAMTITQFSQTLNGIHFEGQATSLESLKRFTTYLRSQPGIRTVSIDKIENKTTTAILSVSLTATFEKEKEKEDKK